MWLSSYLCINECEYAWAMVVSLEQVKRLQNVYVAINCRMRTASTIYS